MSCLENASKLYQMIGQGQVAEAFEQFYHDDVVVQEANGEVRNGKAAQREAIKQWQGMVKEMHGGGVGCITANEETGIACVESWTDITFQNGHRNKLEEVAVQHWQDGKIIKERFYYNVPPQAEQQG